MPIAQQIAPQLPYLRWFARALSGSQIEGDGAVVAMLEALVADPSIFAQEIGPRLALYQLFLKLWRGSGVENAPDQAKRAAERHLDALTPLSRQAFLLRSVEGFSPEDVGVILGRSASAVSQLIEQAGREIAAQVSTTVLIIEDEPIIALDIEAIVEELGHSITGIARTHKEAVALVQSHQPGLVLADIQLADGSSGLEAVNEILQGITVPVIFITAYPERLLTGDRPEPAFLITKPFQEDAVKAAISQALFFDRKAGRSV